MYTTLYTMAKGITQQLRELVTGEMIEVENVTRSNLHLIAKRLGIQVKITKWIGGFYVTRIDELIATVNTSKKLNVDELRALMNGAGKSSLLSSEPEPETEKWEEMPPTFENGDILYWHKTAKGKPICYKRESDMNGA